MPVKMVPNQATKLSKVKNNEKTKMAAEVRKKSGAWHHLRETPYQHNAYALYAAMRSNNSSSNGAVRSTMPRNGSKKRGKQQFYFAFITP